jgi:hypothetical protein
MIDLKFLPSKVDDYAIFYRGLVIFMVYVDGAKKEQGGN